MRIFRLIGTMVGLVSLLCVVTLSAEAQSDKHRVRNDGGSRVTFLSDAVLETITGVSSHVSGTLRISPNDLSSVSGSIEVPVSSIRTGIDLRDEHLRGADWLDAAKYPDITFKLLRLKGADSLEPNKTTKFRFEGELTLHGVTKVVRGQAKLKHIPLTPELGKAPGIDGNIIRVRARMKIKLSDFGVTVPAVVKLKVSDEIMITVNLRAIKEGNN